MEGMDTVMLDTGGDISEGGDLGELGVRKSTGDIRAGVVMADTYLPKGQGVLENEAQMGNGRRSKMSCW